MSEKNAIQQLTEVDEAAIETWISEGNPNCADICAAMSEENPVLSAVKLDDSSITPPTWEMCEERAL